MGHDEVRGETAAAVDAHAAGLHAEVLLAAPADDAIAAAHPRMDQAHVADADALGFGADGDHLADILVAHGERQFHAAILQLQLLAAADVVIAVPDVEIGMADASRHHAQDDICSFRSGRIPLHALQRRSALADIVAEHAISPGRSVCCGRA